MKLDAVIKVKIIVNGYADTIIAAIDNDIFANYGVSGIRFVHVEVLLSEKNPHLLSFIINYPINPP